MIKLSAAKALYDSINKFSDVDHLINEGEVESVIFECKEVPSSLASINQGFKAQLAEVVSAFSNTEGGVVIFGVKTSKKGKDELDYLIGISQIGNISTFLSRLKSVYPLLTEPLINSEFKIIKNEKVGCGIALMYVPKTDGDPVCSRMGNLFYMRVGETNRPMSYQQLRRMFLGSEGPDLRLTVSEKLIGKDEKKRWELPIVIENYNTSPAKNVTVSAEFAAGENVVSSSEFRDVSTINPGKKLFMNEMSIAVHRGLSVLIGRFFVIPSGGKRSVDIKFTIYAEKMRAVVQTIRIVFRTKTKSQAREISMDYLY